MKWRKLMSGILSAAMLVTSITPVSAAVEEVPADVEVVEEAAVEEAAGKTVDGANLLAEFTFDGELAEDGGAAAIIAGSTLEQVENGEGKAVSFNGVDQSVQIGKRAGGSALLAGLEETTISFDVKPEGSGNHDWVYFVAPDGNQQNYRSEHYLGGLIQDNGNVVVERYNSTEQDRPTAATGSVTMGEWSHIDVVVEASQTTVYVNGVAGEAVASEVKLSDIVGDGGIFQLGKANWESGEYFKGQLDNFRVYDAALSAEAVAKEYESGEAVKPVVTPAPVDPVELVDIAPAATPEAFYTSSWEKLAGINNPDFEPTRSNNGTNKGWGCWGGVSEWKDIWVSYTWPEAVQIAGNEVFWYDNSNGGDGGVQVPSSLTMQYKDENGEWQDANIKTVGYLEQDCYNVINIDPVTTTSIRMVMKLGDGAAVGIYRWKVYNNLVPVDEIALAKKQLQKVLDKTGEKYESFYTPETWAVLEKAMADAEALMDKEGVTKEELENAIAVIQDAISKLERAWGEIESIDDYKTSTAAGVAPILPQTVVAQGLIYDEPTPSKITWNNNVELGESFNAKLVPVTWEEVDASKYAAAGSEFEVKGTVEYDGKTYDAKAVITVKEPEVVPVSNSTVTFENVQLTDEFWKPKQKVNAINSLNKAIAEIAKKSGGEPNFTNAIKKLNGEEYEAFQGYVFQDSDIYKSLEAISYTLFATKDDTDEEIIAQRKKLEETIERWIGYIEQVQYADGYIDTHFTLRSKTASGGGAAGTHRWQEFSNHEMYNAGHFLESVVAYTRYREGIGDPDYRLYVVGKRFADEIVSLFGPDGTRHEVPGHEEIELAFAKFAKLVNEHEGKAAGQKYLDTAKVFIDRRGENRSLRDSGYKGNKYSQDLTPIKEETNAVGHAVRATYFYAGVTDIAVLLPEGDADREAYLKSMDAIWDSVVNRKMYITGGIGVATHGEEFGEDYELPNDKSYVEICANIALANWNQRMNLIHEDAKYVDVIERDLYNSILVGTNLEGNLFFYSSLLDVTNGNGRSEWFGCACCPPNLMRTIAKVSEYMYTVHDNTLFTNLYIGSEGTIKMQGTSVDVKQETNYPWDGDVKMTVSPETEKEFTVKIRVPGWTQEQTDTNVTVTTPDGHVYETSDAEHGYISITRTWKAGDVLNIHMPMEIRKTQPDPNVTTNKGKIALERGPVVYCMERAGNAELNNDAKFDPHNFVITDDAELTATYNKDLLNGVVEINGDVKCADGSDAKLQAVPYYAWNNRGDNGVQGQNSSTKMLIWVNTGESGDTPVDPVEPQLRDEATPSASYVGWGEVAANFADNDMNTIWNGHSDSTLESDETYSQWMMYDFGNKKAKLSACSVNFKDDGGGVMTPKSVTIEYADENGEWKAVTPKGEWVCASKKTSDPADVFEFEQIETSKIRVTMEHQTNDSGTRVAVAVYDWKLTGELVGGEPGPTVDKAKLQAAADAAAELKKDDYTADSWKTFEDALNAAKAVIEKADATQEEVDAALTTLNEAKDALKKAEKPIEIPEVLADFDFDDEESGFTSAYGTAAGNHELKDSYAASAGKALYLDGTNFLNVTNKDGGSLLTGVKDLTVSFEMKSDRTGIANWPFYAAPNGDTQKYEQEHYIGLLETSGALKAERYNGGPRAQSNEATASSTDWFRVDLVYAETGTELYVNGEKQGETVASTFKLADILGDSSILQIGKANWESGEYFKGWIDNYKIVSKALTAEEIKANADAFLKAKPADKTALEKKIKAAISEDKKDQYTEETWKAYADALAAAKAVEAKADATQTEVDEALKTLTEAQKALKKAPKPTTVPVDKKALQTAVDAAAALKATDYTAESWAALQSVLKDAQAVLDKADAAQADVDAAVKAVDAAVKALVKATQPKPPVDHSKHIGMTFYAGDLKYKITKDDGKVQEVRVTSLKNKKAAKVTIPKKVTCTKLSETFKVTSIKAKAFKGTNIKKVVIGANVTKIGPNAFLNCKKLTTVTIGKSVKSIGTRAFYGCAKLTKVTIKSKVLKTVKKNAFKRISKKAVIKVPKGKKKAYASRFKGRIAKGVKIK